MMKLGAAALSSLLLLIGCISPDIRQPVSLVQSCPGLTSDIQRLAEERQFPGIAVAVVGPTGAIWSYAVGVGDLETGAPINPAKTLFRIGSTSKALSAYALQRLASDGLVNLDAPIGDTVSELPEAYRKLTLRQLAGHLGGVRHYKGEAELSSTTTYPTAADALPLFINDPLVTEPGAQFHYSTYSYTLITAVLERQTGKPFLQLMDEVLRPLGTASIRADTLAVQPPLRTQYYYLDEGKYVIGPWVDSSYKWAGGGMLASVADLARFGHAHFALGAEERAELWTRQRTADGNPTNYGMGWFVRDGYVEHPGGSLGGTTLLRVYPAEEVSVALAANLSFMRDDAFGDLPDRLAQCFSSSGGVAGLKLAD